MQTFVLWLVSSYPYCGCQLSFSSGKPEVFSIPLEEDGCIHNM